MSPDPEDPNQRALRELVLGYLSEHPQAVETLEGIAEWWIERRSIRVELETLSQVLEDLIARDLIEAGGTGASRRYWLKPSRTDD